MSEQWWVRAGSASECGTRPYYVAAGRDAAPLCRCTSRRDAEKIVAALNKADDAERLREKTADLLDAVAEEDEATIERLRGAAGAGPVERVDFGVFGLARRHRLRTRGQAMSRYSVIEDDYDCFALCRDGKDIAYFESETDAIWAAALHNQADTSGTNQEKTTREPSILDENPPSELP